MDKIFNVQQEIGAIVKDKKNPFYHSTYTGINTLLAQLLPLLENHNLVVMQPLTNIEGRPAIQTIVYDVEAKEALVAGIMPLPEGLKPQEMGSAITYYRRYSLQSMFLLRAQDDDANSTKSKSITSQDDSPF